MVYWFDLIWLRRVELSFFLKKKGFFSHSSISSTMSDRILSFPMLCYAMLCYAMLYYTLVYNKKYHT